MEMSHLSFFVVAIGVLMIAISSSASASSGVSPVTVPVQTRAQLDAFNNLTANAESLSAAATPALLELIDSPEFRRNISHLSRVANMSASDLLTLFNQTLALSVVTHGLYPQASNPMVALLDVTLQQLVQYSFLPNQWERVSLGIVNTTSVYGQGVLYVENGVETKLFGLPEFNTSLDQVTLVEAQDRVSYGALSLMRSSDGIQYYGPVQLVLNSSYIRGMTVLSPFDTGNYGICCLLKLMQCNYSHCDGIVFGTLDHWNHLFSYFLSYWDVPLWTFFDRYFGEPEPSVTLEQEGQYFEVGNDDE